jgi:CRP/FNR family cyclic AMP-dependent transcriptional regulator
VSAERDHPKREPPVSSGPARRRAHLASVPLFARLAPEQLDALAATTTARRLASREELCHKGDPATQVYVLAAGRLKVTAASSEGDEVVLNLLDAGEVIGELPLLIGGERTATVVALEPSELVVLERREFLRFLREHPEAAIELLTVLAERVVRLSEGIEDSVLLPVPARIAKKLLALADAFGDERDEGVRVGLRLSQSELANLVGTTRETVNKQIRAWGEEGIVSMSGGSITIHRRAALERLAGVAGR